MPLLTHHAVVYGHAVHEAVRRHFEARLAGRAFAADDLVAAFRAAWVSEGFLSREHEDERLRAGEAMLRRFHAEEARAPWPPTAVEQEFAFVLERNRVQGRYDLVIEQDGEVAIVDFKTGDVRDREGRAEAREGEPAARHLRARAPEDEGPAARPGRAALPGVGARGRAAPDRRGSGARPRSAIRAAAAAIRRREFPAKPTCMACGQCPFRDICPHTAWGPEE